MKKIRKKRNTFNIVNNIFFIIFCLFYILPMIMVLSASFTSEQYLTSGSGFSLMPKGATLAAYRMAFNQGNRIANAYMITISQAVIGTVLGCLGAGMTAYALSRSNFRFKKSVTIYVFLTMIFGAGMIPSYIVMAKLYHLDNTYLIYILPSIAGGAWNTLIFRTFFKGLPESLFESAKLDGAKELTIFFKIVMPLSTPVFASIGFMMLVGKWNNYTTSMIYIRKESLYTLQFLLQRLMQESDFLKAMAEQGVVDPSVTSAAPNESLKYAMCMISAGPMLFVFPFFQKYFARGLTIGAVKG